MLKNMFAKKSENKSTTEIEPGITLNIYAPTADDAKSYLQGYAGEQRGNTLFAQAKHTTQLKQSEAIKAGIEFQSTKSLPLGVNKSFVAPVPESHIVDGAGAVKATQNGRVINININLAALPPLTGLESPNDLTRIQLQFDHTLAEVRDRVHKLEINSELTPGTQTPKPEAVPAPQTINTVPQNSNTKVSLADAINQARSAFGDNCAFVHENWQNDAKIKVHSANHMLRIAKSSQELKDKSALPASYLVDINKGVIINTLRNAAEYKIVTMQTANNPATSQAEAKLHAAIGEHFNKSKPSHTKPEQELPSATAPGGLS